MNKHINKLFYFVLGAIIFSGITAYATATILSKDVSFSPEDSSWQVSNIEDAINDLYANVEDNEMTVSYRLGSN